MDSAAASKSSTSALESSTCSSEASTCHEILIGTPVTADGRSYQDFGGSTQGKPAMCIKIPKFLLLKWYREKKSGNAQYFVPLANNSIVAHAVTLQPSDRLENCLKRSVMELYSRYRAAQGRKKKATLDGYCEVFVMSDEISDSKETHKNLLEAQAHVEEWKQKSENLEQEIYELYVSMADEVNAHEMDKENFEKEKEERTVPLVNKGRPVDDLSQRQRSRKLNELKTKASRALFFARSFGLMPASLELTSLNGGPTVTLPLYEKDTHTSPCISPEDREKCQQILYLLDRFNVGDEVYHELSMVSKDLPKSYRIKKLRSELNCGIQLTKTPGNSEGVSTPFLSRLETEVRHMVSWQFSMKCCTVFT